jgi:uncharacterized protein YbjT (DUF2867 family)
MILCTALDRMGEIKGNLGRIAYELGVKQIVDISSFSVNYNRYGCISNAHVEGEEMLRKAARKAKRNLVILRAGFFLSNFIRDAQSIKLKNKIFGTGSPDNHFAVVDTRDIGDVAAQIFIDPIEKHGNAVYDVCPESLTKKQQAELFSKVLGRKIEFESLPFDKY